MSGTCESPEKNVLVIACQSTGYILKGQSHEISDNWFLRFCSTWGLDSYEGMEIFCKFTVLLQYYQNLEILRRNIHNS